MEDQSVETQTLRNKKGKLAPLYLVHSLRANNILEYNEQRDLCHGKLEPTDSYP
jgi:hypothetical protein